MKTKLAFLFVLSVVMCLTMFATPAFADPWPPPPPPCGCGDNVVIDNNNINNNINNNTISVRNAGGKGKKGKHHRRR